MNKILPEVIHHFNIYKDANRLIGVSGEVELPELEAITDAMDGSGILGEIDDPVTGQFSSMKIKIPFSVMYEDVFSLMNTTKGQHLTLRGSMQCMDPTTFDTGYYPIKIVIRGKASKTSLGKLVKGKKGEPEIELEVLYLKVLINNKTMLELDKLNFKYVLNGVDMLAEIRKMI